MNLMSEDAVRTLLADAAGAPAPPSRISIEAARKTGRRRQKAARAIGSVAFVAAAVGGALIVPHFRLAAAPATADGPSADTRPAVQIRPAARATPAPAPTQFSVLELSANFGWLPSFWNQDGASVEETPDLQQYVKRPLPVLVPVRIAASTTRAGQSAGFPHRPGSATFAAVICVQA